jgi:hypothetical protein
VDTNRTRTYGYLAVPTAFVSGTALGYLIAYLSGVQPSLVPLVSAVLGLVVAFSVPIWQALFVNAPRLSVEITAIKRTVSEAVVLTVDDDPELTPLREPLRRNIWFSSADIEFEPPSTRRGPTLSDLEGRLLSAKQRLKELPGQIEERKKELERIKSLTPVECAARTRD